MLMQVAIDMANLRVFIGDPYDPGFAWPGRTRTCALPRPITGEFPEPDRLWPVLAQRFERGHLAARRTEAKGWVGLASRREIEAILDETFAGASGGALEAARLLVGELDPRTIYYVVAARDDEPPARRSEPIREA